MCGINQTMQQLPALTFTPVDAAPPPAEAGERRSWSELWATAPDLVLRLERRTHRDRVLQTACIGFVLVGLFAPVFYYVLLF